jgi:Tfp pilus assembly protein PilN
MTEVNLLPPEFRRRQRTRTLTRQIALGFLVVLFLLVIVFVYEGMKLSDTQDQLAAQQADNAALQTQINSLQRFADLQTELNTKEQLVTELESNEVLWSGVLHDLSMVMPSDVFLTSFNGQITLGPGGWETEVNPNGLVGTMQFTGSSLDYQNVALWLDRMNDVDGWDNPWVTSATKTEGTSSTPGETQTSTGVQFNGSVDLSVAATQNGTAP